MNTRSGASSLFARVSRRLGGPAVSVALAGLLWGAFPPATARATPSEDAVFKSIQDSMGKPTEFDSRPVLLLAGGGLLVLIVLGISGKRQQKAASPKPLNHTGRLVKEILREVPLKPAEVRQLKILAEAIGPEVGQTPNPLTLILCPSLLARGFKASPNKTDRKTVARIIRKLRPEPVEK